MFTKALDHFRQVDIVLYTAAQKIQPIILTKSDDYILSLTREIVGQQLSGKVADVIYKRFLCLFPEKKVNTSQLMKIEEIKLREAGLSWAKVRSLKDLAEKIYSDEVSLDSLNDLDNESVVLQLTKIKGIGPWTAEMFLMFALAREDVFSPGDLGLRNGIMKVYNLKVKPSKQDLLRFSHKWQPYRTYASIILWKTLDNFTPPIGK